MKPEPAPESEPREPQQEAVEHVTEAHRLLSSIRDRLEHHPELDEAIERLEMALSVLTTHTGGLL